jgi:antibiotic biosynthesis monooxygenase (ABM) superfamily enzyme
MNLAMREGDTNLLVTAKRRLAETERQFEECCSAMRAAVQAMPGTAGRSGEHELAAAGQMREYATA